jgi:hypothetical protein
LSSQQIGKKALKYTTMCLLIAGIAWAYALTYCTIRLYDQFNQLKANLPAIQFNEENNISALQSLADIEQDINKISAILPNLERNATRLYWLTRPLAPALKLAGGTPVLGRHIKQVNPLLNYTKHIAQAGTNAIPSLEALINALQMDVTSQKMFQQINAVLLEEQDALMQASERIEEAVLAREQLDLSLLPGQISEPIAHLDGIYGPTEDVLRGLAVLPNVIGAPDAQRTYLLLAQNRDELRATGGFISGIGRLELAGGQVIHFEMDDSYSVDDFSQEYPTPPEPLEQFMLAEFWLPRDANWSPDFPTAARQAQELVTLSTGQPSDGVLAFDQEAVKMLVDVLGPLDVDTFPEAVTANNVEALIQQAWSASPSEGVSQAWWQQRKAFMPQLGTALLDALLASSDKETLLRLGRELIQAIKRGHVLVYLNDSQSQALLAEAGLDNGIHPGEGDYLLVVDANIGFNKVDPFIQRQIIYSVELSNPQAPIATLINRYNHAISEEVDCVHEASYGSGTYGDLQKRCYWNYWRVYKPTGTQLYAANQTPVPGEWLLNGQDWSGHATIATGVNQTQVVSGLFVLPTNQHQDVSLQFVLPPEVIEQTSADTYVYRLKIGKQAGLKSLPVSVQIKPPSGYQLKNMADEWQLDQDTTFWIWEGEIRDARMIELTFISPDKNGQ